jgi:diamine N-acetyltransferase
MPRPTDEKLSLEPVTDDNWRDVAALEVAEDQKQFVAEPAYYLALCAYGRLWNPLAICLDGEVAGFLMWAIDPGDGSCWLGGILVNRQRQRRGIGRAAVKAAVRKLSAEHGCGEFALSYQPSNEVARGLYLSLGFVETGEHEDEEVVARLRTERADWGE